MLPQKDCYPSLCPELSQLFQSEGIVLVGVCPAKSYPEKSKEYGQWIEECHHGQMTYLAKHAPLKYNPQAILPQAKSLLFCGLNYHIKHRLKQDNLKEGKIAAYAYSQDYHKVFKKKLKRIQGLLQKKYPLENFRCFTDTSPLDERFYACKAGIGFIGKNRLLISSTYGTYFFLGEILSTKEFPCSTLTPKTAHGSCPLSCFRCFKACPTGALTPGKPFNANLCIAYLTIELKGSIPLELRNKMGGWLFGCDLCQQVCPFNLRAKETTIKELSSPLAGSTIPLEEALKLTPERFLKRFAGSPVMRAGREAFVRNACIATANNQQVSLKRLLVKLAKEDTSEIVKEHAQWALDQLEKSSQIQASTS